MNIKLSKLITIFLLGIIVTIFTNCGNPFSSQSTLVFNSSLYGSGEDASYKAFAQTVYPITRKNCIGCHSTTQPLHASNDMKIAHDAVISEFKVNFLNIPASRMIAKLRDESHNCWGSCADNAKEMQQAITAWHGAIQRSGAGTPGSAVKGIKTAESRTLALELAEPTSLNSPSSVFIKSESATLKAPMVRSSVGSTSYVWVPSASATVFPSTDTNTGSAFFKFQVPSDGRYQVFSRISGSDDQSNSFYTNVFSGNTSLTSYREWRFDETTSFIWMQAISGIDLTKGINYTLEFKQREDGSKLSSVVITKDTNIFRDTLNDLFSNTISFDISGILGVADSKFLIDVEEYDLYTYKFSNPRIEVIGTNVKVKDLKILINGNYNPQHSTYTMVNTIVTPEEGIVSEASMIMMKDKGMAGDKISLVFEALAPTTETNTQPEGPGPGIDPANSLMAFQRTVYPISTSSTYSCIGCHTTRFPKHASEDPQAAHDDVLNVVNFTTPASSTLVQKVRVQRHNCGADCDQMAQMYEAAIAEWKTLREQP